MQELARGNYRARLRNNKLQDDVWYSNHTSIYLTLEFNYYWCHIVIGTDVSLAIHITLKLQTSMIIR
jgi:predicted chitinase